MKHVGCTRSTDPFIISLLSVPYSVYGVVVDIHPRSIPVVLVIIASGAQHPTIELCDLALAPLLRGNLRHSLEWEGTSDALPSLEAKRLRVTAKPSPGKMRSLFFTDSIFGHQETKRCAISQTTDFNQSGLAQSLHTAPAISIRDIWNTDGTIQRSFWRLGFHEAHGWDAHQWRR
jgi:hypothetical protein